MIEVPGIGYLEVYRTLRASNAFAYGLGDFITPKVNTVWHPEADPNEDDAKMLERMERTLLARGHTREDLNRDPLHEVDVGSEALVFKPVDGSEVIKICPIVDGVSGRVMPGPWAIDKITDSKTRTGLTTQTVDMTVINPVTVEIFCERLRHSNQLPGCVQGNFEEHPTCIVIKQPRQPNKADWPDVESWMERCAVVTVPVGKHPVVKDAKTVILRTSDGGLFLVDDVHPSNYGKEPGAPAVSFDVVPRKLTAEDFLNSAVLRSLGRRLQSQLLSCGQDATFHPEIEEAYAMRAKEDAGRATRGFTGVVLRAKTLNLKKTGKERI